MVSKIIGAVFVLSLIAGAARAQTACPAPARPVVPDPIAYSSLGSDRVFFHEETRSAMTVIRKARQDVSISSTDATATSASLYVAFGVDIDNKRILFQITFASDAELSAFQTRLNSNLNILAQEQAAEDLPFFWIISSNLGSAPPPPPPGGPTGIPYPEYLGTRLVQMGEAFAVTQKLAIGAD